MCVERLGKPTFRLKERSRAYGCSLLIARQEAPLSIKNNDSPEAPGLPRLGLLRELRDTIDEADRAYLAAKNGEQQRAAILVGLRGVLQFNSALMPPIKSLALSRHFDKFTELFIGRQDDTFKKSKGHGLTTSGDDRVRNALIAVAFKILTEGGQRQGNMSRKQAGEFIARTLKRIGIKDGGDPFTSNRVQNIYLEIVRTSPPLKPARKPQSLTEAVNYFLRDREKGLSARIYHDQMNRIAAWRGDGKKAIPAAFRTIESRKELATQFLALVPSVTLVTR